MGHGTRGSESSGAGAAPSGIKNRRAHNETYTSPTSAGTSIRGPIYRRERFSRGNAESADGHAMASSKLFPAAVNETAAVSE